jgi:hypothetical protein
MIWLCLPALAGVGFESSPRDHEETVITVTREGEAAAGETVRIVMRPGLGGSRELAVGITDGRGRVKWIPEGAGLTEVRAGAESVTVLVAGDLPPVTVGVFGLLAAVAAGFLVVGFRPRRER